MTNLLTTGAPAESKRMTLTDAQPEADYPNANLTDAQLYGLCKQYGAQALEARRKFIGLLPEVHRRGLHLKKGFGSIKEFAARLAGVSEEQVLLVLRLERKFEDKPVLKIALTDGAVSINKLARVASIATTENQEHLAKMASLLPNRALEVFVHDEKSMHVHSNPQQSLPDVNLLEHLDYGLQKDLIERHKKGINISALLKELLQKYDEEIAQQKAQLSAEAKPTESRYIKVAVKEIIKKEHGVKCAKPGCPKPAAQIHHTDRFAMSQVHDPRFMAPLCAEHHQIAHTIDRKYQMKRLL